MYNREIKFDKEARDMIMKGVELTAKPVSMTLGAKGKNVIIQNTPTDNDGGTRVTKDGVSVANSIDFDDRYLKIGSNMVKMVAQTTCDSTGDGTTTATILFHNILKGGIRHIETGIPAMDLKKGMDKAVGLISEYMKNQAKPCKTFEEIKAIASISANNDHDLGESVAKAMHKIGPGGIVDIQDSDIPETTVEPAEGMKMETGFVSPYFVTNRIEYTCELDNPMILISNMKISSLEALLGTLDIASRANRSLLVIGSEFGGDAIPGLAANHLKNIINCCAIKAPSVGMNRIETLEDLATLTGGEVLTEQKGLNAEHIDESILGSCDKIVVSKRNTTIIEGHGDEKALQERKQGIKNSIKEQTNPRDKQALQDRLARLESGVAVIKVGALSNIELKEKKDRLEDSIGATTAAMEEGIIPGGGFALAIASEGLQQEIDKETNTNIKAGMQVIQKACQQPLRTIAQNCGQDSGWIYNKAIELNLGFNALTEDFEDLMKANIIDPLKVPRVALEQAVSVASVFLSTDAVIVDKI